jgi:outer membrane protein
LFNLNSGLNYGFSFNLPIVNGFINRRNIQQARITVDRTRLLYEQAKTNINVGVKNAYTVYDNAKKILLVEEENIGLAKENLYIALEIFKRSANTFIEVRTAQQSLADAYNRLINARYVAKVAETQLLQLNGSLLRNTPAN